MTDKALTGGGSPPRVLFPLTPFADESAVGLICRTAEWNHLSPADLLRTVGLDTKAGPVALAAKSEELAACLGVPLRDLQSRLPTPLAGRRGPIRIFDQIMQSKHVNCRELRVSPAALRKSPHHRLIWNITALPCCAETWQSLIDRCPSCCARLLWFGAAGIHTCSRCGFDLRRAEAPPVASALRSELAIVASLLSHDPDVRQAAATEFPPVFRDLSPTSLFELIVLFARSSIEGSRRQTSPARNLPVEDLARGCRIAIEYPSSFANFAAAHTDNQVIAPFFCRIARGESLNFDPDLRAFATALVDEHEPLRHGPARLKALREQSGRVSLSSAAKTLRVDNATVRKLITAGALETSPGRGDQRCHQWLSPESVEALDLRFSSRLSAVEFHREFGLPYEGVEQLVSAGALSVLADDAIGLVHPGLQLQRRSALEFIDALKSSLAARTNDRMVSLQDAFTAVGARPKPWAAVLKAALDRRLPTALAWEPEEVLKIEDLLIADDLARDIACGRHPDLLELPERSPALGPRLNMSRLEVERHLNCYPRDVSWLIEHGHLRAGSDRRSFSPEQVEELGLRLISSREIAWRWRISPELRDGLQSEHGIQRELGPFWPRERVMDHLARIFPQGRPN
ncbi:TniQ family protein [Phenylobacterium soli]|nr:TniQ family protein [Phenylobacterium soli]